LGNGIFNANGEKWRYQRKAASHIFNVKNFRDEFTEYDLNDTNLAHFFFFFFSLTIVLNSVFVKEMHVMCDKILNKAVAEYAVIDFHEIMFKFTLDSFV
jgi:fatty acid omega-hydroxylase